MNSEEHDFLMDVDSLTYQLRGVPRYFIITLGFEGIQCTLTALRIS